MFRHRFIVGEPTLTTYAAPGFRLLRRLHGEPWKRTVVRLDGRTPDMRDPALGAALLKALGGHPLRAVSRMSRSWPFDIRGNLRALDGVPPTLSLEDGSGFGGTALVVRCARGQPDRPVSMRFGQGEPGDGLEEFPYARGEEGKAVFLYGPNAEGGLLFSPPLLARSVFRVDVTTAQKG